MRDLKKYEIEYNKAIPTFQKVKKCNCNVKSMVL